MFMLYQNTSTFDFKMHSIFPTNCKVWFIQEMHPCVCVFESRCARLMHNHISNSMGLENKTGLTRHLFLLFSFFFAVFFFLFFFSDR